MNVATWVILAALPLAWIMWDVVLGAKRQPTESQWLAKWSREWNVLPFVCGVLCGHWFVQSADPDYALWPVALSLAVLVAVYDLFCFPWPVKGGTFRILAPAKWMRYPGLWLLLGVPIGHVFWPQRLP